jgi:WD40 repeat protein
MDSRHFVFSSWLLAACVLHMTACNSNSSSKKSGLAANREPIASLEGNVALAFSPDGKWLAIGAELVDTSTWKVVAMLEERVSDDHPKSKNHWGYTSAAFSPDSKKLALGDQDGTLRILDIPSVTLAQEVLAHGARLTGIGYASDNVTMVTSSVDDLIRLRVWNSQTDELLFRSVDHQKFVEEGSQGRLADIIGAVDIFALSPNRELFAVADVFGKILVCSVADGKVMHEFMGPDAESVEMDTLAFTFDSSQLLIGVTPKVFVYSLDGEPTGVEIRTNADSGVLDVLALNESGLIAISYGDEATKMPAVAFYDLSQQKALGSFFPHEMRGSHWAASPNGEFLATTGRGGGVRVWKVAEALAELTP